MCFTLDFIEAKSISVLHEFRFEGSEGPKNEIRGVKNVFVVKAVVSRMSNENSKTKKLEPIRGN